MLQRRQLLRACDMRDLLHREVCALPPIPDLNQLYIGHRRRRAYCSREGSMGGGVPRLPQQSPRATHDPWARGWLMSIRMDQLNKTSDGGVEVSTLPPDLMDDISVIITHMLQLRSYN